MKTYLVEVVAYEFVSVYASSEDDAMEKACEKFGENLEVDNCEIIESSK